MAKSNVPKDLEAGEVVYLKSGSSAMTIEKIHKIPEGQTHAHCVYSDYTTKEVKREAFDICVLERRTRRS